MKILDCPLNGPRNISEFACLGEVKEMPEPGAGAAEWSNFVFMEQNPAGLVREWWIHVPTNYVFVVDRDTRTDDIVATYRIGDSRLAQARAGGLAS
jgi:sarcosine oxidase subunit delta